MNRIIIRSLHIVFLCISLPHLLSASKKSEQLLFVDNNETVEITNSNLDTYINQFTPNSKKYNCALKNCYNYLEQHVTYQQTFQNIFDNLTNPTLKYFCRYLFYINNKNNNPKFIDDVQTPEMWNRISNIKNQKLDFHSLSDEQKSILWPSYIFDLILVVAPDLKWLDLGFNLLKNLPDQICNFVKLEYLYLPYNQLTTLPAQFDNLINLKVLCLYRNNFEILPPQIYNLVNLEELLLGENHLKSLSSKIGKLKKLKKLDLYDNGFSQEEYEKIKKLVPSTCVINPSIVVISL